MDVFQKEIGIAVNVVLYEPEIPANTGNVARLCAVVGCHLHLIRPLGFFLNNKHLIRAGLDYWDKLNIDIHDNWEEFMRTCSPQRMFFIETDSAKLYTEVDYQKDDFLVFGSETKGISSALLNDYADFHISLPMVNPRSLNLSNTVAIVVYEAWHQLGFKQLASSYSI